MFHIHWFETKYGMEDKAVYQACRCGKRRYIQYDVNIIPVNETWLKTGNISDFHHPLEPRHDPFLHRRR
jgi:hypothetical protein